ncbi:hypothetical protein [Amycolatopsis sp. EV170708-02-1]|uniref:hypothetical protein n=1 Tax=Amycolatopsis sp. EV170708-02-1 TaxID=2919322 RepID=UPI001F0C4064|nr:hypothetical protein [Amycolatopsis sp. EV170708-02-1]UMP06706.1 hypothetical protein MJQ72_18690 [Amycolatopsis sp. EV170708-02-1]
MKSKLLIALLVAAATAACSESGSTPSTVPSSPPAPSWSPTAEDVAKQKALEAYEGYWRVSTAAEKAPRSKDWRSALGEYLVDPELTRHLAEIQNLASVPSHMEGDYRRSPAVTAVSLDKADPRIKITDCLDRTGLHLVSDKPGEQGRVLDNPDQPRRYEFRAEVVRYASLNDRWLVQVVVAALDKPC